MIKKINRLNIFIKLSTLGLLNWLPDKIYLQIFFKLKMGYRLNLKDPKGFNEKLQWLKLYDRNHIYPTLVDKYEVRHYIQKHIGEKYLIPLIGIFNSFEEIKRSHLPTKFVLKCTHGTHCSIICTSKADFDFTYAKRRISKWFKKNYFWYAREWPYKKIVPRIICEEFMSVDGRIPEDYKVFCFNGEPKLIRVDIGRFSKDFTRDFYSTSWEKTHLYTGKRSSITLNKPNNLEEMLEMSRILSKNFAHVRLDWYIINNRLYFGEFTLYHAAGFKRIGSIGDELVLGSWLALPQKESSLRNNVFS